MEVDKKVYVAQEAHDAAHCNITENPHNHPDVDCGHYVTPTGPELDIKARDKFEAENPGLEWEGGATGAELENIKRRNFEKVNPGKQYGATGPAVK